MGVVSRIVQTIRPTRGGIQTIDPPPPTSIPGIGPIVSKSLHVETPQSFPKIEAPLNVPPSILAGTVAAKLVSRDKPDHTFPTQSSAPTKVASWAKAVGLRRLADLPAPQPLVKTHLPDVAPEKVAGYDRRILGG